MVYITGQSTRLFARWSGIGCTANTLASPYVATHHLVLSLVLAWSWLFDCQPLLALPVYVASLTPLARWSGDQALNWLDFFFPWH